MGSTDHIAYKSLRSAGSGTFDFVSTHTYSKGTAANPSSPANALKTFRSVLDQFCSEQGWKKCPKLHISEWNSSLDNSGTPSFGTSRDAAFVSLFLSLAIDPSLGMEEAHFYAGSRHGSMALFSEIGADSDDGSKFRISPSAYGFAMHSGFRGGKLFPIQISPPDSSSSYGSALDAALAEQPVVAYSVKKSSTSSGAGGLATSSASLGSQDNHSIVVTNF